MKRKFLKLLGAVLMTSIIFSGCSSKNSEQEVKGDNVVGIYQPGTYEAIAKGFGGDVKVTITVDANNITEVLIEGNDETEGIGSKAIDTLPMAIKEAQGADIDGVSGATATSNAIKTALTSALALAKGESTDISVKMKPGIYTGVAQGFAKAETLSVHVKVNETSIESIEVDQDNGDTKVMVETVEKKLIPRMLEIQSVSVDAISGATVTSNAVKAATEDALKQALEGAGTDLKAIASFNVSTPKIDASKVLDTKVLVIGMGGSGIAAATSAAEEMYEANGQDTSKVEILAIDKAGKYGGTSALTSSPMAINPPSMVKENGSDFVDVNALREDWLAYTEGDAKDVLIDVMLNKSGETLDWLMGLGFEFAKPVKGFGTPYDVVCYYGEGLGTDKSTVGMYFDKVVARYTALGGEYLLETEGTELIIDANGVITGAKAVGYDGTKYTINADAVILAGGGYAGNAEMLKEYLSDEYYPLKGAWNVYGSTQNDGKTIQMAIGIGAGTYNIGVPPMTHIGGAAQIMHDFEVNKIEGTIDMWTGRTATWSLNDIPMIMAVAPDTIAVGTNGKRFTDESGLAMMEPWKAGPKYYTIWSDTRIKEIMEHGFEYTSTGLFINQGGVPANEPMPRIYEVLDKAIDHGFVYKADTLAELSQVLGMDKTTLEESVAKYNSYCETGNANGEIEKVDRIYSPEGADLGEAHYLKGIGSEGPYYAVTGAPYTYSTAGGLNINEKFEVLKQDGVTSIPGLYAVGTDSIGVLLTEKKEYVKYGGAAQGWAFTSGKEAGRFAVEYLSGK
ncbi:MAG: fumarate reductase/succinate dehydrogenase flavoprotein domain protein [Anaerocolumna sp.]|jgi:fumarate reductase flavoprotein subunit|nr:fumarate reductase/succinate dehydrogenase flavoprotein domain protein [Anaerocolumna sp.]